MPAPRVLAVVDDARVAFLVLERAAALARGGTLVILTARATGGPWSCADPTVLGHVRAAEADVLRAGISLAQEHASEVRAEHLEGDTAEAVVERLSDDSFDLVVLCAARRGGRRAAVARRVRERARVPVVVV